MDFKSLRAGCWEHVYPLSSGSVSLLSLLMATPPIWNPTFSDLQTHSSIPVHSEKPKLDNKLRHELLSRCRNRNEQNISHFFSCRFPSNARAVSIHVLHFALSSFSNVQFFHQHRQFPVTGSAQQESVKFTWWPVGMWICECSRSHFFKFFFFLHFFLFLKSMRTLAAAG